MTDQFPFSPLAAALMRVSPTKAAPNFPMGQSPTQLGPRHRQELFSGEDSYFKQNPHVAGMAAEDGKVILNPYSKNSPREQSAVYKNELARLFMRERGLVPDFTVTDQQRQTFDGTPYEGKDAEMRQTLAARILSGDPSAGETTPDQDKFAKQLGLMMKNQFPSPLATALMGKQTPQHDRTRSLGRLSHALRATPRQPDLNQVLQGVYQKYPALKQHGFQVGYGSGINNTGGGGLEFFPPDEEFNPFPGVPYIEVYDRDLEGKNLEKAIFGDALHYLPQVDKEFSELRDQFFRTLTPEQKDVDKRAYEYYQENHGEKRPFDQWFDVSRKDAYLRGYLAPDERNEWAGAYTPSQTRILEAMKQLLTRPVK